MFYITKRLCLELVGTIVVFARKKNLGKKEAELERRKVVGLLKIVLFSKAVESVKDGD